MTLAALPDPSATGDIFVAFLSIVFEGAPYILLGTLLSGMIDAFLPARLLERVLPKSRVISTFLAGFLGLVFPVCECAIVPVIRRLVQKGLPVSCAVTYMLAAPIVNPVVALATLAAFRGQAPEEMTMMRLLLAYGVAVGVGMVILKLPLDWMLRRDVLDAMARQPGVGGARGGPWASRVRAALETAARDFIDVSCFLVLGALATALFNTSLPQSTIDPLAENAVLAVLGMMGLAFGLALCSSSDAFIAATFFAFPPAAKLAFLVFGPMMDIKLVFLYGTTFRRRFVAVLAVGLFLVIGMCCLRAGGGPG
jgi:uncharacterized membrane protein YraQ (UPF0718 family)